MTDEPVEWSEDLHLGVDSLDEDHRALIAALGAWCEAVVAGAGPEVTDPLFKALIDCARRHFSEEEAEMERRHYHGSEIHRREHQALMARLDHTFRDIYGNAQYDLAGEFIDIVRDWAAGHIVTFDRQYAEFLKSQGDA